MITQGLLSSLLYVLGVICSLDHNTGRIACLDELVFFLRIQCRVSAADSRKALRGKNKKLGSAMVLLLTSLGRVP